MFSLQTCSECRDAIPAIPILLTLILGLVFVVAVVAFNFEASPTIDSLLFFTQVDSVCTVHTYSYAYAHIAQRHTLSYTTDTHSLSKLIHTRTHTHTHNTHRLSTYSSLGGPTTKPSATWPSSILTLPSVSVSPATSLLWVDSDCSIPHHSTYSPSSSSYSC